MPVGNSGGFLNTNPVRGIAFIRIRSAGIGTCYTTRILFFFKNFLVKPDTPIKNITIVEGSGVLLSQRNCPGVRAVSERRTSSIFPSKA
jgi:hypothetical protein